MPHKRLKTTHCFIFKHRSPSQQTCGFQALCMGLSTAWRTDDRVNHSVIKKAQPSWMMVKPTAALGAAHAHRAFTPSN
jgi:hypothetical protein